jgi:superfamily I DNA/RNA helicase
MATHTLSPRTCVARKKRLPMKVSKGLGFPVVALPDVGHMPAKGEDEQEAARVFYVAATRATQRLVIWLGGDGVLAED